MAVTTANPAPYAPASAIIGLVEKYRNKGLPKPFTADVLVRAGVSESLVPRTQQALVALELMNESGEPSETLEGLRLAAEAEFKPRLAEWVKSVYAEVFSYINANDDERAVRDAFRFYKPIGQQDRMVSLFLNLCREANLRNDDQSVSTPRRSARKATESTGGPAGSATGASPNRKQSKRPTTRVFVTTSSAPPSLPAPIAGLLAKLPPEGGDWTQIERDKFVTAFEALLDFSFRISSPTETRGDDDD